VLEELDENFQNNEEFMKMAHLASKDLDKK
jgi:hypothetical protein